MLPLGHLGIGRRLVAPWTRDLPWWAILLGTVLPDLIDKPLYYGASWLTGKKGLELGLFLSGTRTFGHTLLLTGILALASRAARSGVLKAIVLGMLTHLFLDTVSDWLSHAFAAPPPPGAPVTIPGIAAVLWPLLGWQMPFAVAPDLGTYAANSFNWVTVIGELLGALLLVAYFRGARRRPPAANSHGA